MRASFMRACDLTRPTLALLSATKFEVQGCDRSSIAPRTQSKRGHYPNGRSSARYGGASSQLKVCHNSRASGDQAVCHTTKTCHSCFRQFSRDRYDCTTRFDNGAVSAPSRHKGRCAGHPGLLTTWIQILAQLAAQLFRVQLFVRQLGSAF